MPSSTSNSESQRKALWPVPWLVAVAIVIGCVGSWEIYWRGRGFVPAVSDDAHLWAMARREATQLDFQPMARRVLTACE